MPGNEGPIRRLRVLGRRDVFRWMGVAGLSTLPIDIGCGQSPSSPAPMPSPSPPPPMGYFTAADVDVLNALADAVLPPDDAPGGSALGVVNYIETLLTAFNSSPPRIFAGGPCSGREALPSATGGPSANFPPDDFANFLPLDRFQTQAWMLRILGSSGVPGGGPNDAVTGPVVGLQEAVATAISEAQAVMPAGVAASALSQQQKETMLGALDNATRATLIELVLEGAFTAPEYGGNTNEAGWQMVYFEGDAQPVGYSWFNPASGAYTEDPNHPVSTANPGPDPMPLDAATEQTVSTTILLLQGTVFP
jgi:hypothetical protein